MTAVGLKFVLLLAVLAQCLSPRSCAAERVVVGTNCHERGTHAQLGDVGPDDGACDRLPADGHPTCVCERPRGDAEPARVALAAPGVTLNAQEAAVVFPSATFVPHPASCPDPNPPPGPSLALSLPLLI